MKRYNKIMSVFTKTAAELEKLSVSNDATCKVKMTQVDKLQEEMAALDAESQAADLARKKILEILG